MKEEMCKFKIVSGEGIKSPKKRPQTKGVLPVWKEKSLDVKAFVR